MGKEKQKQDAINHLLDEANEEIIVDRIHENLQIDSESQPTRGEIVEEVKKLNVRRRPRKNPPRNPSE